MKKVNRIKLEEAIMDFQKAESAYQKALAIAMCPEDYPSEEEDTEAFSNIHIQMDIFMETVQEVLNNEK